MNTTLQHIHIATRITGLLARTGTTDWIRTRCGLILRAEDPTAPDTAPECPHCTTAYQRRQLRKNLPRKKIRELSARRSI